MTTLTHSFPYAAIPKENDNGYCNFNEIIRIRKKYILIIIKSSAVFILPEKREYNKKIFSILLLLLLCGYNSNRIRIELYSNLIKTDLNIIR